MALLSPGALSDPAWLRVAWVAGLVLCSLAIWAFFLLCSLRGRAPPSFWAGQQLGEARAPAEKRRKKTSKGKAAPGRKQQALQAVMRQEVMSAPQKEKSRSMEESSSGSSGSPSPGDTLPWNLAKHQRTKRSKSVAGNGTVLDPAERAVIRIADERDRVQKKTFTKWVNKHLIKAQRHVNDLYEDLRDGHNLISLLEVLSGDTLPREKGRMRFHKLQNVQIALDYLKRRQVKLVNIRNDDIADGNPKLTLGLIWTIILHFQISDIQVSGQSEDMTAKEKLLLWSQRMVEGYQGLRCDNFTNSWRDGRLFNAIIHRHKPMLIDMNKVYRQANVENLEQAFSVAEQELGVTRLLDPEDVDVPQPDEKSIITYVSSLYDAMPRVPEVQEGVKANELQLRWQEYSEVVTLLLQWIRHHTVVFEERKFPASYEEIEVLWRQFLKFKETELPAKESDKNRSKAIFQSLEPAVQSGQVKVPPGYHPLDVEKEWGKLHVAILEREKLLRSEFERLERLQRIVSKLQMESGLCEEQLNQADTLLQSDIRLLNAGKAPQKSGEIERDLDKADAMLRLLFNDVQALKDGRHPQGEQMYRRVYRLHERLVAIRTEYNLRLKSGSAPIAQATLPVTQRPRPELEDVTLRYLQDLLAWVEENQRRISAAEWGIDLPTVEAQLGSHRGLHQSIEEFRAKIERARADEAQLSPGPRGAYRDCLAKLDVQYAKLMNSSKARLRHLESLSVFVAAATKELMWLNEKEEEEVNYDWSERNSNMAAKKESYSGLMRELEQRERKVKEIQTMGDRLLREEHPGKPTVEAFQAALQTQWSWMLQLCCCIEAHLKENTNYLQFFADVKAAEEFLRKTHESLRKKFVCDRSATVTRLEDLLQDSLDEKEHLAEYQGQLAGLAQRAKAVVQLKPRSPSTPLKGRLPLQAVCDYKQVEITVHKGDSGTLLSNAQPHKWKVLNAAGVEAVVPSVCFLVPPPNKEALDAVGRLEATHQGLLALWHQLHIDLKSLLSWQCLQRDVQQIQSWSLLIFRTMSPEDHSRTLRSLETHYQEFLRSSQDAQNFFPDDRLHVQRDYSACTQKYELLLRSLEQGEQEESLCRNYISQLKDIRLQLEGCESRTVHRIRLPLDQDPAKECAQRISDQQQIHLELEGIQKSLTRVSEKMEQVLSQPEPSSSAPTLRSELDITLQKMDQVYSLSGVYLEKLKTINLVIRSTQGAEELVREYEEQLKEVQAVPADLKALEETKAELKRLRREVAGHQPLFSTLEADLGKASEVNERMVRGHSERDVDLDRYRERVQQLLERWQAVLAQIDLRQRELDQLGRQLRYYRESYSWLMQWLQDARQRQESLQAVPITDSRAVREQLLQEKKLLEECEQNREKVEECQRFAKQYINAIKDYELQLVTYKAQVEPVVSPAKKPKFQSASDSIIQEYVDLRTRYSELTTLTSQYIKFITETLRRLEEEERAAEKLKEAERRRLAEVEAQLEKQKQLAEAHARAKAQAEQEAQELQQRMQEEVSRRQLVAVDAAQQKQNIQEELMQMKLNSDLQVQSKQKLIEEAELSRKRVEEEIRVIRLQLTTTEKQKSGAEEELQALRARAEEAERQKRLAQEEAERLRKQVTEEAQKKKEAEEELKRKVQAHQQAAREKQAALEDLQALRLQAEEAERRMKQAEQEKERQIHVAQEVALKSAEADLQSRRLSFAEKTAQLELSLKQEHITVTHLQEEAERMRKQQLDAERVREEAEKEVEKWRQKANEALRLRLQAEEVAHKKALAQEEAEKQKEDAEREARRRAKAEESALRQKEMAEEELEKQRQQAEGTAQQKWQAEQELIRLKAEMENGEQQRLLLEEELFRLKAEVSEAIQKRKELEEELAKLRAEMELLLQSKAKAEAESRSTSEKSKQILETEAGKLRELAEEAARLRALSEEAKRQRQLAEEEAARQRAEAERILKEKLAAVNDASRLKAESEIALKEKEAENERLRRLAEDEAYQRRLLEEQAMQHKRDIEEKIAHLKQSSASELERQKVLVDETLKQRRVIEEEIRVLKLQFERASVGKVELEEELGKIKQSAEAVEQSKEQAEREAEKLRQLALAEEHRRREAEEKVQKILAAEQEAGRQRKAALEEVERLKARVEEAKKQKELAEHESERQIRLAQEAAQKRIAAEEKAHLVAAQQKEQEILQTRQQEQSLLDKLREEAARAQKAAEEAEFARIRAEQEAVLSRQLVEEAERLKQRAEEEAQAQAKAQWEAEKLRKEAELEAAKRAQAEQAALRQKQLADAEMEKHKKFAEQTLRQKAQVEQELAKVRLQQEETEHQRSILDEELQRLKDEVTEAMKQKALAEEELFKVKIHMEELIKLKTRIEEENKVLIMKDKDNMQKFLAEEAEKMKQVAEEAARLSVEAQEAARMRKLAEEDLAKQRALAEKILKEKMQAIQEASRLKAEAEMLQKQKDLAQEHAKRLQEDKEQMLQQLAEETEGFQRTLEAERRRQLEMSADAERLKLQVSEMSRAQAKAEEEARQFKKQTEEISQKLHQTELATQEKVTLVHTLERQRQQSDQDAERLRQAIAELEKEKEKLKREAGLLQQKAEEMQTAQEEQLRQEAQMLQQTFLVEKDALLQKEKFVEEEKTKLEKLFQAEVGKAQSLRQAQEQQQQEMEQEKQRLRASLEEARVRQAEAEANVRQKQEELQRLEEQRRQQEQRLAEENQKLRERLERLQEEHRVALAQTREMMIQTDDLPREAAAPSLQAPPLKAVPNGRDAVDGVAQNGEPELAFEGIRHKVPARKLAEAGILSRENLEKLAKGTVTTEQLSQRDDIQQYLRGTSSIAGLLIKPANEKMSIYQAWKHQLLSPGTSLILLEAQAASGFIVDPVENRRMSVNEAVKEGVVGPELHNKLLSAERAVTGYKDPYTGDKISLFQAMRKGLIVRDHGIRLLEAQIATGGIIDPINSHRLPVEAAFKRGYFDAEMQQVLSDPADDTKGFFDPNTQENLTYLQLMERCVKDPETGLFLLPLTGKAAAGGLAYTDREAKDVFQKATVSSPFGRFKGKTVTIWEIITSEYFTEEQRQDLLRQYKTGKITVEKIIRLVITVVEESEKKSQLCFEGLRAPVPAAELVESKVLDPDLYGQLQQGKTSVKDVAGMDSIQRYLQGSSAVAGILVESSGQKLLLSDALKKNLLRPEVALNLLEAQAGTGYILDPVRNKRLSVEEAVRAGTVGPELHEKLLSAEKAVTGYRDPYTGQVVSLFQALQKGLLPKSSGIRLLDAQLATGGIIDPVHSHRLPLEAACKRGYFSEEMNQMLSAPADEARLYYDPSSQEEVTYAQLQKKCRVDKQTGLYLLPLSDQAIRLQQEEIYSDSQAKESFDKATVEVAAGSLKGKTVTIWELIHSEYFTEEQKRELIRQYKSGKVTIERVIKIIITIIEEAEAKRQEKLTFSGLRAPVPANELLESRILSKAQYEQLKEGRKSVKDLSEVEAVKQSLQGSACIAGVYVEGTKERLSLYEAMRRNLLLPSTAAVLLEAQAATGFLVDPIRNQRLYVNEAVKAGLVGPELHEKLLSAEKAVTGYKDPYSGNTISLFEAMKKGLIVREHAIRLLEAQVATGGIIDPVHSHRLPVEVAYKRGYFDEAMNRTLSDPADDTKGFFDPNTKENLTYLQLKERCIEDPETGLYLLVLKQPERPAVVETTQVYTEAETKKVFEDTQVDIPVGGMAGSSMSLWDIMHSNLIPEEQRKRLMEEFRSGQVTKERMIIIIIEIIEKTEIIRQQDLVSYDYVRHRITAEDLYEARIISLEIYNTLKQGSKTIREILEIETTWKYLYGTGCVAGISLPSSKQKLGIYQALKKGLIGPEVARPLLEAQAATGFIVDPIKNEMLTVDEAVRKGVVGPEMHDRLLSAERAVTGYRDPYSEQKISLFQAMKKELIPSEEALRLLDAQLATGGIVDPHLGFHLPLETAYHRGYFNRETYERLTEPSEVRSYVDPSTEEKLSYAQILKRCKKDEATGHLLLPLGETRKLTFRGLRKQISVEELVRSKVMDEATAQRLQEGLTSVEEVSRSLQKFLEGTSCIAGVYVDSSKERLSVYQAMKKGIIRPGTAFELLEAQAATGYVIDPIKGLKLTVEESVRMGIVGPEFKDKLLSAERAVTGYKDPYSGKLISLFQAMKKGLILKDHGIRLLEAQIATGGIIDPEESHRLPVEVAYKRGLFDEEMNGILLDPSDDTKGFFDPNTEENLTYLQLMERCITDPETGLCLLPLKEKKRERKTSSKSSVRKRRVVIVDPETGKEMSVYEAYRKGLIDHQTYLELSEQECEWEEITISSSDGVVKSMIIDRRSGRQYDIDDAIAKGLIDQSALDQYRSGTLSITEFADMLSGNVGGFRSRSSSVGSSSSYPISPAHVRGQLASWSDPAEETGPVAGILDTDTLEKVSITEAMHRNLVDNITGQRLLEAQACTGGIIDPSSGEKFTVADAVNRGLVDKIMVDRINLAQKAFHGFEDPRTKSKMSAAQALKKGWLYYEAGQRFLEVQYLTGGLIEPEATGRVSLDEALQKGTIDARTAQKLRDVNTYSKYLTCPKTKLKISYKDAMDRSMVEEGSGLRLLEASSQSSKGYYSPYNVSGSGSTSGSRSGSRTGSRQGSRRGSFDATGSGFSMSFSSSSYSSSAYGRRYATGPSTCAAAAAAATAENCGWEGRQPKRLEPQSAAASPPHPSRDAPWSVGELLAWFSEAGKSWMGLRGGPEAAAPPPRLPPKDVLAADAANFPGCRWAPSPPDSEEDPERAWLRDERKECRPEVDVHAQLLSLRHWLDALEKRLPRVHGQGSPRQSCVEDSPAQESFRWGWLCPAPPALPPASESHPPGTQHPRGTEAAAPACSSQDGEASRGLWKKRRSCPSPGHTAPGTKELKGDPAVELGPPPTDTFCPDGVPCGTLKHSVPSQPLAMGNSGGRPSCLGVKSQKAEDFLKDSYLKDLGLEAGPPSGRNNREGHAGAPHPEKPPLAPRVIENGWPLAQQSSPLPKQDNRDVQAQNRGLSCNPLKAHLEAPPWSPPGGLLPRTGWAWKPLEVTEVTEVTETVVTEIMEVTEFPGGDKNQESVITRTVKVLAEGAWPEALAFLGDRRSPEQTQEALGKLLAWVRDLEDLVANQKSPSSEAKVVKAQLQEQKLLKRLLQERQAHVEQLLQAGQMPLEPAGRADGLEKSGGLASLREKWTALVQGAEARHICLEQILPAAQAFQQSADAFQDWLRATEGHLGQQGQGHRTLSQAQNSHQQSQALSKEIRSKPEELDGVLACGQRLMDMVSGEEAQLVQEKMDALQAHFLRVARSSADIMLRLEQALEAPCRLEPGQEALALWLGRMERELLPPGGQSAGASVPVSTADREKFEQALGSELARLSQLSQRLEELGQVHLDAHAVRSQISDLKLLSAEILYHHGLAERLVAIADPVVSLCSLPAQQQLQALVQPLKEQAEHLLGQSSACAMRLDHAQLLLAQYAETREELFPWLEETQQTLGRFSLDAVSCEALKDQQELLQSLREAVAEHKPLMTRLQRVQGQLAQLCPQEAAPFQQGWQAAEEQYEGIREHVRQAAVVLEDALPHYSQLSEHVELMAERLERLQGHVQNLPAARGDTAWPQQQLKENSLRLAELEKLRVALETLRGQGAEPQTSVRPRASEGIQARVEQLWIQWEGLWQTAEERESWLQGLLALASRFWHGVADLGATFGETQQMLLDLAEVSSSDPGATRVRLGTMQVLRGEIDSLQGELDSLGVLGMELMSSCGDVDKVDITKSLDDLHTSWNSLSKAGAERQSHLEDHLQAALLGQETAERLAGWLERAELRVAEEFLVGGEPGEVKQQLLELKGFKRELYQCRVDMESLGHWGGPWAAANKTPPEALSGLRERWLRLEEEIVNRQHQLEEALLALGQFQSQLEELLQWLLHTTEQGQDWPPRCLDLQSCEIELAKHKVLQNDILSRARTVQSVTKAAEGFLLSSQGASVDSLRGSLQELQHHWDFVLAEMESRRLELESNLHQVQDLTLETTELLQWLDRVEVQLFSAQPSRPFPGTAKEKLAAHLELCKEAEVKQEMYTCLREQLLRLLASSPPLQPSSTKHSLSILEQKWKSVAGLIQERKEQLSEIMTLTTEFHATSQELLEGVGAVEEAVGALPPPSYILENITRQMQEQKVLLQEVQAQGEKLVGLEAVATRLEDFGRQPDCGATRRLVLTAKERLARVLQLVSQRGTALEEARRGAKQFHESRLLLLNWLEETESMLETPSRPTPWSPEEIKARLGEQKDFQKGLRTRRLVYEAALRSGHLLSQKALLAADAQALEEMLGELKGRWEAMCTQAAEREHQLEEALLFSGRFPDALQTLMDWLYWAEPQLAEETPVAGDRDVVSALVDKHKVFQKELGKRAGCMRTLQRSARDLMRGSPVGDSQWLQSQVEELAHRWELVCQLSLSKQARLEAALQQAEEFDRLVHALLNHLLEAEKRIKSGAFPSEATAVQEHQGQLKVNPGGPLGPRAGLSCTGGLACVDLFSPSGQVAWLTCPQERGLVLGPSPGCSLPPYLPVQEVRQSLRCHQLELDCITSLGEEILSACHPDSASTIKSWLTVTRSRFQEVESCAQQQEERLRAQAASLAAEQQEEARLLEWIAAAEESLNLREQEPLPEDSEQLQELTSQHAVFMEQLSQKQPEVEKVTKSSSGRVPRDPLGPAPTPRKLPSRRRSAGRLSQRATAVPLDESPLLVQRWQQLWLLALDRQYRLENAQQHLREVEEFSHFDFADWRKRYLQWISHMKSRALDVFRTIDRDQDGRISQEEFIEAVLSSRFPTSGLEMSAVASIFDLNGDGYIDYYEFVSALHPSRDVLRRSADADQIQEEVDRQVSQCNCAKRFQVEQISANRYRFGESQQLRMVRILRSTLMVRVGGGWIALDEFLVKNDPCRVKGRTNVKINEKYLAPNSSSACQGTRSPSAPSSAGPSPGLSMSSLSLYSSASAPSSPLPRKVVLRRTRSRDRSLPSRSSLVMERTELAFATAGEDGTGPPEEALPPDPSGGPPP
ncbi:LOW QUALITY PROTEIN: plectin-like [Paroedura picta]|uniref:LOW QUALITY PROTEIN: plectin-like n=1 Tax=Paroedura picta TaxID=143630 RepID=UPI0040566C59